MRFSLVYPYSFSPSEIRRLAPGSLPEHDQSGRLGVREVFCARTHLDVRIRPCPACGAAV